MCDGAGQESWSYDALGRVLTDRRTTNSITKDFTYAYNLDGSLATLTYPNNRVVTYAYNAAGRALSAVDTANSINYAFNASYAPHGALASVLYGQAGGFALRGAGRRPTFRSSVSAWECQTPKGS